MKTSYVSLLSISTLTVAVGCGGAGDASSGDNSGQAATASTAYTVTLKAATIAPIAPARGEGFDYPELTIAAFPKAAAEIDAATVKALTERSQLFTDTLSDVSPSDPKLEDIGNLNAQCALWNSKAEVISIGCSGFTGGIADPDNFKLSYSWSIDESGAHPLAIGDVLTSTDALKGILRPQLAAILNANGDPNDPTDYVGQTDFSVFYLSISKEGHAQLTVDLSNNVPAALFGSGALAVDLYALKSSLVANGAGARLLAIAP